MSTMPPTWERPETEAIEALRGYVDVHLEDFTYVPPELASTVAPQDHAELVDFAFELGLESSFKQEGGSAGESFVPAFDYEGG